MSYIYYKYLQEIGCVSQDHVDGFFQSGGSLIFVNIYTIKVSSSSSSSILIAPVGA